MSVSIMVNGQPIQSAGRLALLTLTSDGGDREDGNVWYAGQVLLAESDLSAARTAIAAHLHAKGVKVDTSAGTVDCGEDAELGVTDAVTVLAAAGISAYEPERLYVVEIEGF